MIVLDRPRISELYVFQTNVVLKEENEHEKILYFFPNEKSINDQLNSVGLSQAIICFTKFFGSMPNSIHTKKTKRIFRQLSENIWIVIVVSLPKDNLKINKLTFENRSINDQIIESVLATACHTFELFNGKVSAFVKNDEIHILKDKLEHFFSKYLNMMLFEHCDILDCISGIQYTVTEPCDFARVHGFLNRIGYSFSCIKHMAFFYEGRLIYATLDLSYVRYIYHYLNSFLFVEQPDLMHTAISSKNRHLTRYLVGPKDLTDVSKSVQCPPVRTPESDMPNCQLVAYQSLRAVVCFFVEGTDPIPMEFFIQFDQMVGPRLTLLADRLASSLACSVLSGSIFPLHLVKESSADDDGAFLSASKTDGAEDGLADAIEDFDLFDSLLSSSLYTNRFIYWNPLTHSVMTTLHAFTGSGKRALKGAKPILDALINLRSDLLLNSDSWHEEISIRYDPQHWIVCRRSNGREIYLYFNIKQDSLTKLDKQIERVYSTTFRGIFLLD